MLSIFGCLLAVAGLVVPIAAATTPAPQPSTEQRLLQLESDWVRVKTAEQSYQYLREETKSYRDFLEKAQTRAEDNMKWWFGTFLVIVSALIAVATALGLKSYLGALKSVEKTVKDTYREKTTQLIDSRFSELSDKLSALESAVAREARYGKCRVLIAGAPEHIGQMKDDIELLRKSVTVYTGEELDKLAERVNNDGIDMVIFRFSPRDGQDPRLSIVTEQLRGVQRPVPLLVYTHGNGPLVGSDRAATDAYRWSTFANNPATLLTNIYLLAHAFAHELLQGGEGVDTPPVS